MPGAHSQTFGLLPRSPVDAPPTPVTTHYIGRRRALGGDVVETSSAYIGRRRALVAESTPNSPHLKSRRPNEAAVSAVSTSAGRTASSERPDTSGTSALVGPVDEVTCLARDQAAVVPLGATRPAGRRRADRPRRIDRRATPGRLLSGPVLMGLASLTVSVAGVTASDRPVPVAAGHAQIGSIGTMSGTDAVGAVRPDVVSRNSDRTRPTDAPAVKPGGAVDLQAKQRAAALRRLTDLADQHAGFLAANRWQLPLSTYRLTATFGEYGLWSSYHTGLDFAAPTGTPLVAMAPGVVSSTGYSGAYGNLTVFTLDDGTELWYAHQAAISVSAGDRVSTGDVVGSVGSTGNVTGPHLHLEVRPGGGDPVDPYAALVNRGLAP